MGRILYTASFEGHLLGVTMLFIFHVRSNKKNFVIHFVYGPRSLRRLAAVVHCDLLL